MEWPNTHTDSVHQLNYPEVIGKNAGRAIIDQLKNEIIAGYLIDWFNTWAQIKKQTIKHAS